jgi:hypothetical protein
MEAETSSEDSAMAMESIMDEVSARKKKSKRFPLFFILKNFKTAFLGDIRQWASRYRRHRLLYRRRHRRS